MSYLFHIDLIVIPMRANSFNPCDALLEVDCHHEPIVVPLDVEHDSVRRNESPLEVVAVDPIERQRNQRRPDNLDALFRQGDMLTGAPQPATARSFETWPECQQRVVSAGPLPSQGSARSHNRKIMVWKTQALCATVRPR
jgi:hypothetical protein